ncbi:YniB family protein [Thorsellia kenyensis]|uniref:YniB family protein n=1 Tax=Thorsellia kenyensis TaxID=1549888 RepID=A0ABV6CBJ1_9GAMM
MTYQQARILAYIKMSSGWFVFAISLLWTVSGALKSLLAYSLLWTVTGALKSLLGYSQLVVNKVKNAEESGLNFIFGIMSSVIKTLDKGLSDMPVMGFFWTSAPTPVIGDGVFGNLGFVILFWGMFIGMALVQSSDKLFSQVRNVQQTVDSLIFIETARGEKVQSADELISRLKLKHHSVFIQYFPLYVFPMVIIIMVKFALGFLGM